MGGAPPEGLHIAKAGRTRQGETIATRVAVPGGGKRAPPEGSHQARTGPHARFPPGRGRVTPPGCRRRGAAARAGACGASAAPLYAAAMLHGPDDLFALLDRLGIRTETIHHRAVFTVAESNDVCAHIPGFHTKNLFLKDRKDGLFLVTLGNHARIDLKRLHTRLGAASRLSFCSAEQLGEVLGVTPGSVTTFAAANDESQRVCVVLEAQLMAAETIALHPLINTMTTLIARNDLVRFLEAVGHAPEILALAEEGSDEDAAVAGAAP